MMRARCAAAALAIACVQPALAANCPIEKSVYADMEGVAELTFQPGQTATVTNAFTLKIENVSLDGIVQWSERVRRADGTLMNNCPQGDVTGAELAECTVWEGVIYTTDDMGNVQLLPPEGADAPYKLILSDLGRTLRYSSAYGAKGFAEVPWDVFEWKRCNR